MLDDFGSMQVQDMDVGPDAEDQHGHGSGIDGAMMARDEEAFGLVGGADIVDPDQAAGSGYRGY